MSTDTISNVVGTNGSDYTLRKPTTTPEPIQAHVVWDTWVMHDEYIWADDPFEVYRTEDLITIVDADGHVVAVLCPNCEALVVLDQCTEVDEEHWRCSRDECGTLFLDVRQQHGQPLSGFRTLTGGEIYRLEPAEDGETPYTKARIVEEDQVVYEGDLAASIPVLVYEPDEITQIVDADERTVGFVCPLCGHRVLLEHAWRLNDDYCGCDQEGCPAVVACFSILEQQR